MDQAMSVKGTLTSSYFISTFNSGMEAAGGCTRLWSSRRESLSQPPPPSPSPIPTVCSSGCMEHVRVRLATKTAQKSDRVSIPSCTCVAGLIVVDQVVPEIGRVEKPYVFNTTTGTTMKRNRTAIANLTKALNDSDGDASKVTK